MIAPMRFSLPVLALVLLVVGCSSSTEEGQLIINKSSDGQIMSRGYEKDDGVKIGKWTYWFSAMGAPSSHGGQKREEGRLENGKAEGLWTFWHRNGQERQKGEYKNGVREGLWTFWDEDGQKRMEGEFKGFEKSTPIRSGKWTYWDEDGSINEELSVIYKDREEISELPKE